MDVIKNKSSVVSRTLSEIDTIINSSYAVYDDTYQTLNSSLGHRLEASDKLYPFYYPSYAAGLNTGANSRAIALGTDSASAAAYTTSYVLSEEGQVTMDMRLKASYTDGFINYTISDIKYTM